MRLTQYLFEEATTRKVVVDDEVESMLEMAKQRLSAVDTSIASDKNDSDYTT
jgi:hypothetical protein